MARFFPVRSQCQFDTSGERRFAERLEKLLEDDYLCWSNVPSYRDPITATAEIKQTSNMAYKIPGGRRCLRISSNKAVSSVTERML